MITLSINAQSCFGSMIFIIRKHNVVIYKQNGQTLTSKICKNSFIWNDIKIKVKTQSRTAH